MLLCQWDKLPADLQCDEVRKYYDILSHQKTSLVLKRLFDIVASLILLIVLSPVLLIISAAILLDSGGHVMFRQTRVTANGKLFRIFKFRTMVTGADKSGALLTVNRDNRVTRVGRLLRKFRFDELPQLLNILSGDMTFVGTRPEVIEFVNQYTPSMKATLLLPAGITSDASIYYKDEAKLLSTVTNADKIYIEAVLPAKMYYNLIAIENFSLKQELKTMFRTILAVCGRKYVGQYSGMSQIIIPEME